MKSWLHVFIALAAVVMVSTTAHAARPSKPMDLFLDNPIETSTGKQFSPTEIEQSIKHAGPLRGWKITRNEDGTLNAHLVIRKHTLDVALRIDGNLVSDITLQFASQ